MYDRDALGIYTFNSRPHAEVDLLAGEYVRHLKLSTHDLTQRSTLQLTAQEYQDIFQLTTSRRGRPVSGLIPACWNSFNSRPHAEVDAYDMGWTSLWFDLSTHDLTQRSTIGFPYSPSSEDLSTHDLTQRSTILKHHHYTAGELSTHDLTQRSTMCSIIIEHRPCLSTHDLTQRSTYWESPKNMNSCSFNSRPHAEVDSAGYFFVISEFPFNSRPHAEVDLTAIRILLTQ